MQDLKESLKITLIALMVIAILTIGITALNGTLYPWWLSIQRKSVEESKSFTDANNLALARYQKEYVGLDTKIAEAQGDQSLIGPYEDQQQAIIGLMCTQISTMKVGTVNPNILSFISSNGGCN
jgi:hypothetical protein